GLDVRNPQRLRDKPRGTNQTFVKKEQAQSMLFLFRRRPCTPLPNPHLQPTHLTFKPSLHFLDSTHQGRQI
ncbi:MAG: hypothetical protein MUO64_04335, partial [Anaerolineales bacterium]|nr:hypothetical protein [Anaerolineales bacterium]